MHEQRPDAQRNATTLAAESMEEGMQNQDQNTGQSGTKRRDFLKLGAAGAAAATVGAPAVVKAQDTFRWRMTNAYPPEAEIVTVGPGSATDLIERIETMSNGRIQIEHFGAGELIPALEGFDAVRQGTVEMNYSTSYFWTGRSFAFQYFTTVPFGMNFQGHMAWLYHGGGLELWHEAYEPYNMIAFPAHNTGVQWGGWFRKPIETVDDFQGLKIRIPGLPGAIYEELGAEASVLPGGEIFAALERGVIDAAEYVGPYQDLKMGFHQAADYYYTSGWHEPSTTNELMINREAWNQLPNELKQIVKVACQSCVIENYMFSEAHNGEALRELVEEHDVDVRRFPDKVVRALYEATMDTLEREANNDEMVAKVHKSYFDFKRNHDIWSQHAEGVWFDQIQPISRS